MTSQQPKSILQYYLEAKRALNLVVTYMFQKYSITSNAANVSKTSTNCWYREITVLLVNELPKIKDYLLFLHYGIFGYIPYTYISISWKYSNLSDAYSSLFLPENSMRTGHMTLIRRRTVLSVHNKT